MATWRAAAFAIALSACTAGGPSDPARPGGLVVDLPLPGGGFERVWYRQPEHPNAVLILFAGDDNVALGVDGRIGRPGNFLVRVREAWLTHSLAVAIPDTPRGRGDFFGAANVDVLRTVIAHVRTRTDAPIWLVGTSMGSVRAAYAAAALRPDEYAGLVLTSSVSRINTRTVLSASLDKVAAPALVLGHSGDRCLYSPPSDAEVIRKALTSAPRTEAILVQGGSPPRSNACEPFSEHGYLGIETQVVDRIAAWIKAP